MHCGRNLNEVLRESGRSVGFQTMNTLKIRACVSLHHIHWCPNNDDHHHEIQLYKQLRHKCHLNIFHFRSRLRYSLYQGSTYRLLLKLKWSWCDRGSLAFISITSPTILAFTIVTAIGVGTFSIFVAQMLYIIFHWDSWFHCGSFIQSMYLQSNATKTYCSL